MRNKKTKRNTKSNTKSNTSFLLIVFVIIIVIAIASIVIFSDMLNTVETAINNSNNAKTTVSNTQEYDLTESDITTETEMNASTADEKKSQTTENSVEDYDAADNDKIAGNIEATENTEQSANGSVEQTSVEHTYSESTTAEQNTTEAYIDSNYEMIAEYVESMSLREKICQMMIVTLDSITGVSGSTVAGAKTKAVLEKYPVGGIIHFGSNITSGDQISLLNSTVQSYSKTAMFISIDEEGGRVGRLKSTIKAHSIGAMLSYEKDGEEGAFSNAKALAGVLHKYGFNTDFAPVADVWSNSENTVIGDRAYSRDFNNAALLVQAAVRGFNESNIVCSIKHFPGHGDTSEDSHNGSAYVNKTLEELRDGEFKTFAAGISAGADMVMVGHLVVPSVDKLPATLSKKLITDVLRDELGFNGVVITDSLAMNAISSIYSTEYVAVTAVKAGVDILLIPGGVERTIAAITSAVENGEISEERIDESVMRIITLKFKRGIIDDSIDFHTKPM